MTTVFFLVPDGIDNPARPSGGNVYDRRICSGLAAHGWTMVEREIPGSWPRPKAAALAHVAQLLADLSDGAVVMVDGLIASAAGGVLVPEARRLRLVVLVHLPLGLGTAAIEVKQGEAAMLGAARAVIATSSWTRDQLLRLYDLGSASLYVAEPGVDAAEPATRTPAGGRLLCVAAVVPHKGHATLLDALARIAEFDWSCTCVGALDVDPAFVNRLRLMLSDDGLDERVLFVGPHTGMDLAGYYAAADLFVLASHAETYGMVVTEALARGIPVIATEVGGLPDALGYGLDRQRPGRLVPDGDGEALAAGLREWLCNDRLRQQLRAVAGQRRMSLTSWSATSAQISRVLDRVC